MNKNRIYTLVFQRDVAPAGGLGDLTFQINNNNRVSLLRSISLDIQLLDAVTGLILPLEVNTTQNFTLGVVALPLGTTFAQFFENISVLGAIIGNGTQINLFKADQLKFNSFFIRNNLYFAFAYTNNHPANAFRYTATVTVEIEDIQEELSRFDETLNMEVAPLKIGI